MEARDGSALKAWLTKNKQVTTVTRDRASAYAKAVEEILPDCMQIAEFKEEIAPLKEKLSGLADTDEESDEYMDIVSPLRGL